MSLPSPAAVEPGNRVCIPWVRLFAERVAVATTRGLSCDVDEMLVPLLDLGFEYGATRVGAGDGGPRVFRADGGSVEAIERDGAAESDARRGLERRGAVEIACMEAIAPPPGCAADDGVRA